MSPVRVLIVDDSATMRALLRHALAAETDIVVVGEAGNTADARQKIKDLDPDVLTLDVEMPGMNGLEFLEKVMRLRPMPVIMVSNLTAPGADATIAALETGAFECIAKPSPGDDTFTALPALIRQAAASSRRVAAGRPAASQGSAPVQGRTKDWPDLIAIGASTGGIEALIALLSAWPKDCPPTLIVQHLPSSFTGAFAARLDRSCAPAVSEARAGAPILPGQIYLAPGGRHLTVSGSRPLCMVRDGDPVQGHRPSVDVMFSSVAEHFGDRAHGVILTGMGRDGAEGLLRMRRAGARTLAQDEATSLVWGMPRVATEIGAAERTLPLGRIAQAIFGTGTTTRKSAGDGGLTALGEHASRMTEQTQ